MIANGVMIAHLCLNAPPEFEKPVSSQNAKSEKIEQGVFVWCLFFE
jgi:hypothetical protein